MASKIQCMLISAATTLARVGVVGAKTSLSLATLPPTLALGALNGVKAEGDKLADRADKALQDIGRKCGI